VVNRLRTGLGLATRELRSQRALSQERLAAAAGLHRSFVFRLEKAEVNISLDALQRIAAALEVPVSEYLRRAEELCPPEPDA